MIVAFVTMEDLHGHPTSHEEAVCMDTSDLPISGEPSQQEAAAWGEVYDQAGETQWPALCTWVRTGSYTTQGDSDLPVVSDFEEAYAGNWDSFREYADDYVDSTGMLDGVDETVARYFDYHAFARDLEMDHSVEPDGHGGVFVFRSL